MSVEVDDFGFLETWARTAEVKVHTPPSVENQGWFLGSALQMYNLDYLDVPNGSGGFVDTIWTRHLRVPPPNLYWEIHHELFHLIWTSESFAVDQVVSLINELSEGLGILKSSMVLFTESDTLSRAVNGIQTLTGGAPFAIGGKTVGRYSKLFARSGNGVFPAADFVEFSWKDKVVTEVHLNLAHLAVAADRVPTIYSMPSKRPLIDSLGLSDSPTSLMQSWRTIRTIALVDALKYASRGGVTLSATKAGHTFKQLAKILAYDLMVTRRTERVANLGLPPDVLHFVGLEIDHTQGLDVARLIRLEPEFRRGTLGISDDQLRVADGSAVDAPLAKPVDGARYFTDLPLLGPLQDNEISAEFLRITQKKSKEK